MAAVGTVRLIWSGGETDFCAAKIGTLLAIEERCGSGLGDIYSRVVNGTWKIYDISEVIRLSLIGAGMSPEKAKEMVDAHVIANPNGLAPSVLLSMRILEAVIIGVPGDELPGKDQAEEALDPAQASSETTGASSAQESTD